MGPTRCEVSSRIRVLTSGGVEIRYCQMLGVRLGGGAGIHRCFPGRSFFPIIVSVRVFCGSLCRDLSVVPKLDVGCVRGAKGKAEEGRLRGL